MLLSTFTFGALLPAQAPPLGPRWPRTAAETAVLVRELNAVARSERERAAAADKQRQAAFDRLARPAQASPALRRAALNVAAIYAQRNTRADVRSARPEATA